MRPIMPSDGKLPDFKSQSHKDELLHILSSHGRNGTTRRRRVPDCHFIY